MTRHCLILTLFLVACQPAEEPKDIGSEPDTPSVSGSGDMNQQTLDKLATTLNVKYQVLSNIETDCPDLENKPVAHCFSAKLHFSSDEDIPASDWQLYYSQVYPNYTTQSQWFDLTHLNGDIQQVVPKPQFTGFVAGQVYTLQVWMKATLLTQSQLMPNYWLTADGLAPRVITSTRTKTDPETGLELAPWAMPFDQPHKQIKSAPNDNNKYANATWLFDHNQAKIIDRRALDTALIPTPKNVSVADNARPVSLAKGVNVSLQGFEKRDVMVALNRLELLGVNVGNEGIALSIVQDKKVTNPEGYQLTINAKGMQIKASDAAGAFYGIQSIAGLLNVDTLQVPQLIIEDEPHYAYRGQHIDVARNFHDKAFVFSMIEQMAAYKLNKLHMHLAEDEAWRIELPSLPELTNVGSSRCMNLADKDCLQPQLGGADSPERDGFYSSQDYIDIVQYADLHHIEVIPSLDMPGHSRAAIKAMEARYRYYMAKENESEAKRYLLSDFADKTQYRSIQNYTDNTINVCLESSYAFVDRVLSDLIELHEAAGQPLATYHIGADETAGAWQESPACQALVADTSNEVSDLKHLGAHFIERVSHMVVSKGINVGGWNDGLGETRAEQMPSQVASYIWGALPWGAHQVVSEQAHRNWQIVLSIPDVFYFDFPYEVDPLERGYNWASRRVDSQNVFNFMPDNLPIHAEFRLDTLGNPFQIDDKLTTNESGKVTHQPLPKGFKAYGIQGQLWSETVRDASQAQYMVFPRMLALAERAWHSAKWHVPYKEQGYLYNQSSSVFNSALKQQRDTQWQTFANTIAQKELIKLDKADVFYRIPTVGAVIKEGQLQMNVSLPGLPLEFQQQNQSWTSYQGPVPVNIPVKVRARSADGKRAGRSWVLN